MSNYGVGCIVGTWVAVAIAGITIARYVASKFDKD